MFDSGRDAEVPRMGDVVRPESAMVSPAQRSDGCTRPQPADHGQDSTDAPTRPTDLASIRPFSDGCLSQPADQTRGQKKKKKDGMVGQQEQSIAQLLFLPPTFAKIAKVFLTTTFIQLGTKKKRSPKKSFIASHLRGSRGASAECPCERYPSLITYDRPTRPSHRQTADGRGLAGTELAVSGAG